MDERYPDRIPLNLSDYAKEGSYDIPLPFALTEKEVKYFPNLVDLGDLAFEAKLVNARSVYSLTLTGNGTIHLKDAHDFKTKPFKVEEEVDLTLSPDDPENTDLETDDDGIYDLRGSLLALLFDAIPKNFSTVPLKRIDTPLFTLMSEDEYNAERQNKPSNAFSDLDADDFPEAEEEESEASEKAGK